MMIIHGATSAIRSGDCRQRGLRVVALAIGATRRYTGWNGAPGSWHAKAEHENPRIVPADHGGDDRSRIGRRCVHGPQIQRR